VIQQFARGFWSFLSFDVGFDCRALRKGLDGEVESRLAAFFLLKSQEHSIARLSRVALCT